MTDTHIQCTARFFFIRRDGPTLRIGEDVLPVKVIDTLRWIDGFILWERQGMFRIIPAPVIANLVSNYETARSIRAMYPRARPPAGLNTISWEQGIVISPPVANTLMSSSGKEGDGLGNTNTAADTTGKD